MAAFAATTKTEVAANRYRDLRRDNSLQGLMLTHRPNRIVSSKACGFCHTLRHESPTGHESVSFGDLHEKRNIGEALYNLRRESLLVFEFEKGSNEFEFGVRVRGNPPTPTPTSHSIFPLQLVTRTNFSSSQDCTQLLQCCIFRVASEGGVFVSARSAVFVFGSAAKAVGFRRADAL